MLRQDCWLLRMCTPCQLLLPKSAHLCACVPGARAAQQACAVSERLLPNSMCRPLLAVRAGLRHDLALAHGDERAAEDAVGE
eukprot:scaffold264634_cov27-Tisochrysis_lutea.AAC.1